jgi:hypothetical protein
MPNFLVRVELHSAVYDDYVSLHAAMQKVGFSRTIIGSDGITYQLPTAEYYYSGTALLGNVFEAAQKAANSTGKFNEVIAAQCEGLMWEGLPVAK